MARKRKSAVASGASAVAIVVKGHFNAPPPPAKEVVKMPTTLKDLKELVLELQAEKEQVSSAFVLIDYLFIGIVIL